MRNGRNMKMDEHGGFFTCLLADGLLLVITRLQRRNVIFSGFELRRKRRMLRSQREI